MGAWMMENWRPVVCVAGAAMVCYFLAATVDYRSWQLATVFALMAMWKPFLVLMGVAIYFFAKRRSVWAVRVLAYGLITYAIIALFVWQDVGQVLR
jgi:hypothetical protein